MAEFSRAEAEVARVLRRDGLGFIMETISRIRPVWELWDRRAVRDLLAARGPACRRKAAAMRRLLRASRRTGTAPV